MTKPPRFELTFGKKDEDLYAYIESFGLPKAPLVKKWIREHMERNTAGVQGTPIVEKPDTELKPSKVEEVPETVTEIPETTEQAPEKPRSPFGGMAHKR